MFKKLAGLIAIAGLFLSGMASAQIAGTDHDLRGQPGTGGEVCVVCHTPHNADTSVTNAPLWDHELTVASFTPYISPTLDATVGQPTGGSRLCLSCHDGTVAIDSFGGRTGTNIIGAGGLIGDDLSDDHPISFVYDTALATSDGGLFDPATALSGLGGTINDDMLFAGNLQCGSCHDVHDDSNAPFLRMTNDASAMCFTCHDK